MIPEIIYTVVQCEIQSFAKIGTFAKLGTFYNFRNRKMNEVEKVDKVKGYSSHAVGLMTHYF